MADKTSEDLVQNNKAKAAIWKNFLVKSNNGEIDRSLAHCRICKSVVKVSGGTTNLSIHMRRHHPSVNTSASVYPSTSNIPASDINKQGVSSSTTFLHQTCQPTLVGMLSLSKLKPNSQRALAITRAIGKFIVSDLRPYSVVNCSGFKEMVNTLEPRYTIPDRHTFNEKIIPDMYIDVKSKVMESMKMATKCAITTDGWTSRATESYVTVTSSFIDENWQMRQYVLQTRPLPERHTGVNIAQVLTSAITEWRLPQQPALVTDNAANMTVASKESGLQIHIGCFAHTINLAAQKALKISAVDRLLGRIRRVVVYFHRSTSAAAILKSKIELLSLPNHKLVMDVCTRWNSAADMIERYLEIQPAISATLTSKELREALRDIDTLSDKDIAAAQECLECLTPLRTITTVLCTEKSPTVSIILPILTNLVNMTASDQDSAMVRDMKDAIVKDLSKRYNEKRDFLALTSLMDPRFKSLLFLSHEERINTFNCLPAEVCKHLGKLVKSSEPDDSDIHVLPMETSEPTLPNLPYLNSMLTESGVASIESDTEHDEQD